MNVQFNPKGLLAAALLTWLGAAQAQLPPVTVIEGSVETYTDRVTFPSALTGRLQVSDCGGCASPFLQLDKNTEFNLAGKKVTLREMTTHVRSAGHKPLTIHYRLSDKIVSLVSVLQK